MYSKVKIMGQALHPKLVGFPITLYTSAFICFCLYQYNGNPFWYRVAFLSNMAGVVMALVAAIPGFIDWSSGIPAGTDAKRRGLKHGLLNISALVFYMFNAFLIWGTFNLVPLPKIQNVIITGIGFVLAVVAAYHGYNLVAKNKAGIDLTPEQERIELSRRVTT